MTKLAAIEGQLVGIRNVSTHKSGTLTIHIPEEEVLKAIQAFGWPTMAAPIHVAIAMINPNAKPELKGGKLCQRAAILCNEGAFKTFLKGDREYAEFLDIANGDTVSVVRNICMVTSRRELDHNPEAARKFLDLEAQYKAWLTQ